MKTQPCLVSLEITKILVGAFQLRTFCDSMRRSMGLLAAHLPGGLTLAQSSSHQRYYWKKAQPRAESYWVTQRQGPGKDQNGASSETAQAEPPY